ncbi:MAG: hypothetical protein D3913_14315 [Candidatus Electrothrix sp. LOE1_4_5]|nr:hypothetical protein [Candidatus Electrothrix gigas]
MNKKLLAFTSNCPGFMEKRLSADIIPFNLFFLLTKLLLFLSQLFCFLFKKIGVFTALLQLQSKQHVFTLQPIRDH